MRAPSFNQDEPYPFPDSIRSDGRGFPVESEDILAEGLNSCSIPFTEKHIQAVWYDSRLRPIELKTVSEKLVRVIDCGKWNFGAGPDFLKTELEIDGIVYRGDLEIHLTPSDWTAHGHADDPLYRHVIAHVTWFPGERPVGLPSDAVEIVLGNFASGVKPEIIDLASYPRAVFPETPRPCLKCFSGEPSRAVALLASAGRYRLQMKATAIQRELDQGAAEEDVFYRLCLGGLGYAKYASGFRALAERIKPVSGNTREEFFAYLLGAAGLLPNPDRCEDDETRIAVRRLWDIWWGTGNDLISVPIPAGRGTVRPQNSPARRLAAAAGLFFEPGILLSRLIAIDSDDSEWYKRAEKIFLELSVWEFWERRRTVHSVPERPSVLLGEGRIHALITNVVVPFLLAKGCFPESRLEFLPPEDINEFQREMAFRLLGRDHNPALYLGSGLLLQGLLQMNLDFCSCGEKGCSYCRLVRRYGEETV